MDGPNVNWKVLEVIQTKREKDEYPPLQDIGSCGLHVVSGALHSAVLVADWPVEKVLRGMYKFLKDAPARRNEYMRGSVTGLYPEKFCATRWVENEPVADRAIKIWGDIVTLIKAFQAKVPSKRPKDNKSYNNLVQYHLNSLIPVYLHLFRDVASRLNVFLVKFQTDSPMVPFLSEEMAGILKWAMRFIIQKTALIKADTPYKLYKFDINHKDNLKLKTDIKLTTSANEILKKVPNHLHQGLKDSWAKFLKKLVEKMQEKSPIRYKLVRNSAALDPQNMVSIDGETLQSMFDSIVGIMHSKKRISALQGDRAKEQFEQFLVKVVALNRNEFLNFNKKVTRLDDFLAFYVCSSNLYNDFWYVCKFIFTLCHGQSSVERGFNVNKQTLVENLEELGLTSLRMVYDEILCHGGSINDFPVSTSLLLSCQSAHMKYKNDQDCKRAESEKTEVTKKRKLLIEELNIIKKKKIDEESLIVRLKSDSDKLVLQAGDTSDVAKMKALVVEASSIKTTVQEKEKKLFDYASSIERMEEEIKKLK